MLNKGLIVIISGPSGSGKSTLVRAFLEENDHFEVTVSHTTREKRPMEVHGKDYYFISKEEFEEMIKRDEFVEWAKVHDNYYGTSRKEIERVCGRGKNVILEIDVQGAKMVKSILEDVVTVFVIPESFQVIRERLIGRGTDPYEVIQKRLNNARQEIEQIFFYDYVIINKTDQLKNALNDLRCICQAELLKSKRIWSKYKETFWR